MWGILDRIQHPAIACCWDVFNATVIGELPAVSVPVLNSKIQYVQVKDAAIGALGATYCKLGEGQVPLEKLMIRLRGIGYGGWVTFEWEKAWLPGLAEPEDVFPDAIAKLKAWQNLGAEEAPKAGAKAPAPSAAHLAPAVAGKK
jgi:fatty-acyl-CoA synthase